MSKVVRKSAAYEAFQWKGELEVPDWITEAISERRIVACRAEGAWPPTLEIGPFIGYANLRFAVFPGDWVLYDAETDELLRCTDEVFRKRYEPVKEASGEVDFNGISPEVLLEVVENRLRTAPPDPYCGADRYAWQHVMEALLWLRVYTGGIESTKQR